MAAAEAEPSVDSVDAASEAEAAAKAAAEAKLVAEAAQAAADARRKLEAAKAGNEAPPPPGEAAPGEEAPKDSPTPAVPRPVGGEAATPGAALMASPELRRAAEMLVALQKIPFGDMTVQAFAIRVIQALERDRLDWEELIGLPEAWETLAEISVAEVKSAFEAARQILAPGNGLTELVEVRSRDGSNFAGTWNGKAVTFTWVQADASAGWGPYSSFMLISEIPELNGKRAVRARGERRKKPDELERGDAVRLADPARAAVMEIRAFERLPQKYKGLAPLVQAQSKAVEDPDMMEMKLWDEGSAKLAKDPEVRDAVLFQERLDKLPRTNDRLKEKVRRLRETPTFRELEREISADKDLAGLAQQLEGYWEKLYLAAFGSQGGGGSKSGAAADDEENVTVINVELNLFQVIGVVVVIAALAFGAFQLVKPSEPAAIQSSSLPMYSLKSGP